MKTIEFAFVPSPGMGHIFSAVEFAKRLIQRDERISLTILVISSPFHSPVDPSYTNQVSSSYPSIKFIDLPKVTQLPDFSHTTNSEKQYSLFIDLFKTPVKDAITKNVLSNPNIFFAGVVMDFLCSAMFDVATELGVPSYMFFPSGAALLSLMLYLPTHFNQKGSEFSESDPDSIIPGFTKPVPSNVVPTFCLSSDGGYEAFLQHSIRLKQTKGVFINTFLELEFGKDANETLAEAPPIYTIGPIINLETKNKPDLKRDRIIQWLNNQPNESVIFLCFGSFGSFGEAQLANIATALEHSGHRFLWSIRKKLSSQPFSMPGDYEDFSEALPEGFLERTKDRGLVCGFAPQLEVLANEAVGCFVTHCGWNSVLESLWFGKTVVTWPLYAEQQLNAFKLVKEMGVAVELVIDFRYEKEEIVDAEVIEKGLKNAMDMENPVRKRVKEMGEIGRKATEEGGSSFNSINRFIEHLNTTIKP